MTSDFNAQDSNAQRPSGRGTHGSSGLEGGFSQRLQAGKIPHELLTHLLGDLPTADPQLLLGPAVGEDAAIIDFAPGNDTLLVAKSDPITFATDEIGYYAVNVCANDLAVTGATPRFYLPTVLLPAARADAELARRVFVQIGEACRRLGIVVAGGHSEITPAVNQPVIAGTLLGQVPRNRYLATGGCRAGDAILMGGVAPVEGVSILAREMRETLLARGWDAQELETAANYLYAPGISVLAAAHAALDAAPITAMHDPTEGGIATGVLELALAADLGLELDLDAILVPEVAARLCAEFGLDPLGVIASGALLATCAPADVDAVLAAWRAHDRPGAVIGHLVADSSVRTARRAGQSVDFPYFEADELTRL